MSVSDGAPIFLIALPPSGGSGGGTSGLVNLRAVGLYPVLLEHVLGFLDLVDIQYYYGLISLQVYEGIHAIDVDLCLDERAQDGVEPARMIGRRHGDDFPGGDREAVHL
jgi:hypothetical protein